MELKRELFMENAGDVMLEISRRYERGTGTGTGYYIIYYFIFNLLLLKNLTGRQDVYKTSCLFSTHFQ